MASSVDLLERAGAWCVWKFDRPGNILKNEKKQKSQNGCGSEIGRQKAPGQDWGYWGNAGPFPRAPSVCGLTGKAKTVGA